MPNKRSFLEVSQPSPSQAPPHHHKRRKPNNRTTAVSSSSNNPPTKTRKDNANDNDHGRNGSRSFKKAHTVNHIKAQIRSLKRLLANKDDHLLANVRVEKERALQTAENELRQTERAKRRSEMIARYHKVRFFDRQKATKRLKRARKEFRSCLDGATAATTMSEGDEGEAEDERRARASARVDECELDLNYALYYPLDVPYVSLFPTTRKGNDGSGEDRRGGDAQALVERQGDEKMRELVRKCMAEGTLDALRNGDILSSDVDDAGDSAALLPAKDKPEATSREKTFGEDKDDESDGGFFE